MAWQTKIDVKMAEQRCSRKEARRLVYQDKNRGRSNARTQKRGTFAR